MAELEGGAFALPALASGATYQIAVTATVTAASGSVTNTATVAAPAGTIDPTPGNNSASDTDTVIPAPVLADLSIAKTNGVASVTAGGSTTYTITVTNNGPSSATGAILADPAATGLSKTAVACSATPGQCATAPTVAELEGGAFALPALASGATYEIVVTATVTAGGGTVSNTATVAAPAGTTDPTPGNNSATDTDPVVVAPVLADLAITKTDGVASVTPGGATTYTIVVTNNGPGEVTGATVTDTAPAGLTFGAWTCAVTNAGSGGVVTTACGAAAGSGNLATTVTMKAGAAITYTVPATVSTGATGSLVNTATVAVPAGITDPNPANNSATDTDTVVVVPVTADLAITKTDGASGVTSGAATTYTITVTNNGPSAVTGAMLADPAAAGLAKSAVACSATPGQCAAAPTIAQLEGGFALPLLASGATYQIAVTANVTAASGSVANTATIAAPVGTTDPTPGNNSATDTDPVTAVPTTADLAITKTSGAGVVPPGGSIVYTITVTNNGPAEVTNATVTDTAPTGLTLGSWTCAVDQRRQRRRRHHRLWHGERQRQPRHHGDDEGRRGHHLHRAGDGGHDRDGKHRQRRDGDRTSRHRRSGVGQRQRVGLRADRGRNARGDPDARYDGAGAAGDAADGDGGAAPRGPADHAQPIPPMTVRTARHR